MAGNSVTIVIGADNKLAIKGLEEVDRKASGLGKSLGDIGKIAGGVIVAQGLMKLPGLFSSTIGEATKLGESINAVEKIFGESAGKILDWGKANANAFGLSRGAFQQLAVPLGAMLKNTGMSMDDVSDSTINLTKRAADMASVFNTSVEDALMAIQAGLRGEADPLERYGVSLKAVAVEQEALAMTGKKAAKELTETEKAAARVALIMKQTADSEGDFADTSGEAANAARIQAAKMEDLKAVIGTKLMPVQLKITEAKLKFVDVMATKVIPAVEKLGKFLKEKLGPPMEKVGNFVKDTLVPNLEKLGRWFAENESRWQAAAAAIGGVLVAAFMALAVSAGIAAVGVIAATWPILAIIVAVAALSAGIFLLIKHWDDLTAKYPFLQTMLDGLKAGFWVVANFVTGSLIPALAQLVAWFRQHVLPVLASVAGFIVGTVVPALVSIGTWIVQNVIPRVWSLVQTFFNLGVRIGEIIGKIIQDFWPIVVVVFNAAGEIGRLLLSIGDKFSGFAGRVVGAVQWVINKISDLINWIRSIPTPSFDWVPGFIPGFAHGLERVPKDNFVARLHEGERVLTKSQANAMDAGMLSGGGGGGNTINIYVSGMIADEDATLRRIREGLQRAGVGI